MSAQLRHETAVREEMIWKNISAQNCSRVFSPKNARRHLTTSLWSANVMMRSWPGEDVVPRREPLMFTHEFDLSRRCAFGKCAVFNPLQTQSLSLCSAVCFPLHSFAASSFSSSLAVAPPPPRPMQVYSRWTSLSWTRSAPPPFLPDAQDFQIPPSLTQSEHRAGCPFPGPAGCLRLMWGC